jgi:hypothetical protein
VAETQSAISEPPGSSGARMKGRVRGALICAFFGSAWMFWAAVFAPAVRSGSLALVTAVSIAIVGWAVSRVRAARHYQDSTADRERWASIALLYWINTAAEWLLVAGSVIALAHFRRYSLIPQFLGVIIGLHFLVLAVLLRVSAYSIMGATMILAVLATLLIPDGSIRSAIACAGIGFPMWITAAIMLSRD